MTNLKKLTIGVLLALCSIHLSAQEVDFSFLNTDLSFEERVDILISQMTLEEKISQMTDHSSAIPRLKIPQYGWWNESLHGVAFSGRATVFPQPIGLAASWNTSLLHQVGDAISDEGRAKHHNFIRDGKRNRFQGLTFWAPNINVFRDPRWGRGIETYGEDPFLIGRLGVSFIKGLQGDNEKYFKVIATPKHYAVHSGPEPERHRFDAIVSDKDLYETYLPHFKEAVQEGGAYSIMSAYNRLNGESCSGHHRLLTEILRDEWDFKGYVVSDCGAIKDIFEHHKIADSKAEAAAIGLKSGCDLNCGYYYPNLKDALTQGMIVEKDIDISLARLFLARFKLGMFDPEEEVPYANISMDAVNSKHNQALALKAAQESIVLLKNTNNTLPLKSDIKRIAVIGPNADDLEVLLGNYNGQPFQSSTPLQGIQKRVSKDCEVYYAQGADWTEGVFVVEDLPDGFLFTNEDGQEVQGLMGEYFSTRDFRGDITHTRIDRRIKFDWKDGAPENNMPNDNFSVRWTGSIKVPESGEYVVGGEGYLGFKIYIEDSLFLAHREFYHVNAKKTNAIYLESGRSYRIKIEYFAHAGDANFRLIWVPKNRDLKRDAIAAAKKSDVIIMCMGLSPRLEGEELKKVNMDGFKGGDRTKISLPETQLDLLKAIKNLGKPVVLVLLNGSALAVNWEHENLDAIIEAWYPGQAAGEAIVDVLFGDYNPSGKLPVTFYKSVADLPDFEDYSMKNRTYRYFEGKPLYPFGYGLSYSTFRYDKLKVPKKAKVGDELVVSVNVINSSNLEGTEVVQLYVSNKRKDVEVALPKLSLKGFKRIILKPNETKKVSFTLKPDDFTYVGKDGRPNSEPGDFVISIGGIQPDFQCETTSSLSKAIKLQ